MKRSIEEQKEFLWYEHQVRKLSEKNYRKEYLDGKKYRGKGYELDHRMSIVECFEQEVPVECAGHICNLKLIPKQQNRSKGRYSELTFQELLDEIVERDSFFMGDF